MTENKQEVPEPGSLQAWLKPQCHRLMYGRCTTLYCLRRGGYTGEPADASIATCEPYELFNLLPLPQIPDKRAAEIRERQAERRRRCELTVKNTDIPLPSSIADIDYLLSLLQQPATSERPRIDASLTGPDVPCACGTFNVAEPRALLDGHDHLHTTVYCSPAKFQPATTSGRCRECGHPRATWDSSGICGFVDPDAGQIPCGHRCVFPATEATQVAVEAIIEELKPLIDPWVQVDKSWREKVAATISKHCTADTGEVERLRETSVTNLQLAHKWMKEADRLRAELSAAREALDEKAAFIVDNAKSVARLMKTSAATARADAIRECRDVVESYSDSIGNPSANIITALESLTKKEGDDGPTEARS